ncbi:MAG: transporter substrate-binding domain-containing protein [Magnetococcales bacterium]|nr:transporter substrate-binding domain-containing protein [Magnetococcales bacterium]
MEPQRVLRTIMTFFCFVSLGTSALAEPARLVLNSPHSAPITAPDGSGVLDVFYRELFARLGMTVEFQQLPAERAVINANRGIDDGDVTRISGMETHYPNLVQVPESVMRYELVLFSRTARFKVTGPEDLQPYDVGIVTGWKIVEWNTTKAHSVTRVENVTQLFQMLADDRIDLAIIERMTGMMTIKNLEIKDVYILEPPFLVGNWYLYLHKKHQNLVPRLTAEIRRMKEDGSYTKIFESALQNFFH